MESMWSTMKSAIDRRSFVKEGLAAATVAKSRKTTLPCGIPADTISLLPSFGIARTACWLELV